MIEEYCKHFSLEKIKSQADSAHTNVAVTAYKVISTGYIAPYRGGSLPESILLAIYILSEYIGKGVGSAIVKTLEQDEYFLRTNRIEIPSSDMEIFILNMNPQKHNMAVLGQIVKLIPRKIIESLRKKHKIQTRSFTATSHVVAMIYSQLTHALSLNDVCDGMKNHHGILSHIYCMETSKEALFSQFIYTCQSYIVELSEFGNCTESM